MSFNIDEESIKLIQFINDDTFDYSKHVKENGVALGRPEAHLGFLWTVLTLTIKYPQVELYLKNLLNYFTINELEKRFSAWSVLHQMALHSYKISVNAFGIIINYGINVNIKSTNNNTVAHILVYGTNTSHENSILNLLIKHGIDLNIRNVYDRTVLDDLTYFQVELNEEIKNCIMILIDFGAITCNPEENMTYDFIEYYKNSTIKPAIKNENKI